MSLDNKVLSKAAKAMRQKQWRIAAEHYEQLLSECPDAGTDVYANLARSYRMMGSTKKAENTTYSGLQQHPSSSRILTEQYWIYRNTRAWEEAQKSAEKLVELFPNHSEYFFRLGIVHMWRKNYQQAHDAYLRGLELKHAKSTGLDSLLADIQKAIRHHTGFEEEHVTTEFSVLKGKNNIGTFRHGIANQEFITKVVQKGRIAEREVFFYQDILPSQVELTSIAPQCIDVRVVDGVTYMTLELVSGVHGDHGYFDEVVMAIDQMNRIEYATIEWVPQRTYNIPKTQKSPLALMPFLTHIDDPYIAEELFSRIRYLLKHYSFPQSAHDVVERLAGLVLGSDLYRYITRSKDFVPVHGDLIADNILIKESGAPAVLIDWASFTIGPKGLDLARWTSSARSRISYQTIKQKYVYHPVDDGMQTSMEKILFLVCYILFQLVETRQRKEGIKKDLAERLPKFILPALEDLERIIIRFLHDTDLRLYRSQLRFVEDQKYKTAKEQEISRLKRSGQTDKTELNDMQSFVKKLSAHTGKLSHYIQQMESDLKDLESRI